jgi:hypothetical protein
MSQIRRKELFMEIVGEMYELYCKKNSDYGNSFAEIYAEFGLVSTAVRLTDKVKRINTFAKTGEFKVLDEKIDDTLRDNANYSIMTLVERRLRHEQEENMCKCETQE